MSKIIRKPDSDLEYCFENDCGLNVKNIKNVLAQVPGEADLFDWHWVVQMNNGEYMYVRGGCDYSGWGCRDWGEAKPAKTALQAAKLAPTKEEYNESVNIQKQLINQLRNKQPYGLRESA